VKKIRFRDRTDSVEQLRQTDYRQLNRSYFVCLEIKSKNLFALLIFCCFKTRKLGEAAKNTKKVAECDAISKETKRSIITSDQVVTCP
jgi:hypothetical protein